jgi:hypothetical protein
VKQTIALEAGQGSPALLTTTGDFLGVVTTAGLVRVFKAGGREARPHAGPGEGPCVAAGKQESLLVDSLNMHVSQW